MINWGIVGTGSIAKTFAGAISETDSTLHAVASSSGRAETFAKKYNCVAYEGYDQLINDPDIHAIYVATPHPSHFDITLNALSNKKAVLCEKPMTMNATQTMILIDASRKNNTLLMEAFMYKSHPQTLKVCEILRHSFKPPLTIDAEFCFQVDVPESHRLVNSKLGGGSILDIGCYPMSISRLAVGMVNGKDFLNPSEIECESELNSQGVDLNAEANLTFEDGSTANIKSATNLASESAVTIKDASNTLIINQPWHCGEYTERTSALELELGSDEPEIIEISTEKGIYAIEIEHFESLIESGYIESKIVPHNDSHGNMIALDRWRKGSGVYYESDKGENSKGSLFSFDIKENRTEIKKSNLTGIEKELSRLVFGCDNQSDSNHAFAMFDHFYLSGGNVFDTAYIYNNGKSDGYLGRWVNSRGLREEVVVLGKGAHTPDCYPGKIRPQLEESLERMGSDYLDIYCLHRDNLDVPVSEFIDALSELKDEGLINVFGGSNWSLPRFKEAIDYA
ncbi:MAG TPA: aldo/keto reductase, partial [SAR86 cluster bacterium]|nr:aldo/keto reductase [SAR86 cluster bacterium]